MAGGLFPGPGWQVATTDPRSDATDKYVPRELIMEHLFDFCDREEQMDRPI
jgi:hypothetical protein